MQNKYAYRSRISQAKTREIVRCFVADLTATQTAYLTGINRNTVNRFYQAIRERIASFCERTSPVSGQVELDESFFGARRAPGKRGRGASGKTIVFGIFERNGEVYTEIVEDCSKATLQDIIRGRVLPESVIHTDGWRGYNGLVDVGYAKHFRVDHGKHQFAHGNCHINGIEGFWGLAKTRLTRFKGLAKHTFYLHLKECEFRYNHRHQDLYQLILKLLRTFPLS